MLSLQERFWAKVCRPEGDFGCWVWTAATRNGYGHFFVARVEGVDTYDYAHRVSYKLLVGDIAEGLQLDHLCRNRLCCNPSHLEPVAQQENIRRGEAGKYQSARTRCPAGHPYDESNTGVRRTGKKKGSRYCRACLRERTSAKRASVK